MYVRTSTKALGLKGVYERRETTMSEASGNRARQKVTGKSSRL